MAMSHMGPGGARNLGAIGIEVQAEGSIVKYRKVLSEINTDFMHWKLIKDEKRLLELEDPMLNRSEVKLADGTRVSPQDFLDDLQNGYQEAYRIIMEAKAELLDTNGPLNSLATAWVRILNRATNIYYRLIMETCNQDCLRSGVDRWIAADRFCVGFEEAEKNIAHDSFSAIVAMEHEALLRGDVAYFMSQGNSLAYATMDIHSGEAVFTDGAILKTSATNAARTQIEAMSDNDLEMQSNFIKSSYVTALVSLNKQMHQVGGIDDTSTMPSESIEEKPLSDAEIGSFAKSGLDLLTNAMLADGESAQWIDLSSDPVTETVKVSPMDSGIYSGRGGLAILYERAARVFNNPQYLEFARSALHYEIRSIQRDSNPILAPSGMLTTPGLLLGFWRVGANEGHGDLRDLTRKMVKAIGPRAINRDTAYDIIAGSAGMILVLARIHDEEPNPDIKDLITKLGEHLLANRCDDHGGPSWKSGVSQALCGHSHGMAGIALGLLHAYRLTGRADFRETALATIECEDQLRKDEFGNWPDLRGTNPGDTITETNYRMHAWCHGLPGITLSRAACLQIEDSPTIRGDYEFCLAHTQETTYTRNHLCCGSSGHAEIHRSVGLLMNSEEQAARSRRILETCVQILQKNGLESSDSGLMGNGLLQGMAGPIWAALAAIDTTDPDSHLLLAMP
jgi:type 2 lantibiotic biosynthesis protein LanM